MRAFAAAPSDGGLDRVILRRVDDLISEAIGDKKLPGAVLLVGRHGRTVHEKAYGNRALVPNVEPMTLDTVFDLASLTKVVATATSVMILLEEGRLRLTDRVAALIPGFGRYGKDDITIRDLLTHMSGLRPDLDLTEVFSGYDSAILRAIDEVPVAAPGDRFIYSDINFFLLGDIVGRASGMPLDRFAADRIFEPLRMRDTMFNPPAALGGRIAPTEACTAIGWPCGTPGAKMLRGLVHDPTSRRMGGVAGHAGLFSTARDLSLFCRMLLGGGSLEGQRILSPLSIARMTTPATPAGEINARGLGWDLGSSFAVNRGDLFPPGSFGHTGFTGTSLWLDPTTETFVILLSNRVHPDGKGDVTTLRAKVATVVAAAVTDLRPATLVGTRFGGNALSPSGEVQRPSPEPVVTGLDLLRAERFAPLRGRRVALLTNQTGIARDRSATIDLLNGTKELTLVALWSPEHGIRGTLDEKNPSSIDEGTRLTVHSLYGETRRPTVEMFEGIDTVVVDLQDVGARFYTYLTTLAYVLEEAAPRKIRVVVLDRPNPINGFQIEGPALDESLLGFTGYFPMPIRHGMTIGELARLFNAEKKINGDLVVIPMRGWTRERWFDETGQPWVSPSPNIRNLNEATLYPGIGAIENTNISVGRGTDTPFEQIGAPWIDGTRLAAELNGRRLPGIRFYPVAFTPASSTYAGERCEGVFMVITSRDALRPVRTGVEIAAALHHLYGAQFQLEAAERLLGSPRTVARLKDGEDPARIAAAWADDEAAWRRRRAPYLLYP
ncbi:MAG: DUF1343 domain-containing protein [Acidobacteria bacterium]|nr:DUF1343 domain-containing protein [Acidobacteriota bacterium]